MTTDENSSIKKEIVAYNYCLGFVDLLGQRDAMRGQEITPNKNDIEELKAFQTSVRESIGPIQRLQDQVDTMLEGIKYNKEKSIFRDQLPDDEKPVWDEMQRENINRQRWSDGIVAFSSLENQVVKCPMNGVFGVFALCGNLCLLGLSLNQPIRGAIDISWGVELDAGEIYGPVVANAYQLEAEVAQYPRIVVGQRVHDMLQAHQKQPGEDVFANLNRSLAELCLDMLIPDTDGNLILHYLGETFRDAVTQGLHQELYEAAVSFINEQLLKHQTSSNSKLAFRYAQLLSYFKEFPPMDFNSK